MITDQTETIRLRGIRQNNLKGFDLDLPLGNLIVVTGLSGAGKSSLVFETIHAEGQRRYVETFSPYTRQFLEMLDRPKVDSIENIRPSIAIEQRNSVKTSRSTVGTMTELTDFFKVWFAHAARLIDPDTGREVMDDNPQTIWEAMQGEYAQSEVLITFDLPLPAGLPWAQMRESLIGQGFTRMVAPGGGVQRIDSGKAQSAKGSADAITVVQDRLALSPENRARGLDALATALRFGKGEVATRDIRGNLLRHYAEGLRSPETGRTFTPTTPALFSFNSPVGACPTCRGFGRVIEIDYRLVIPDHRLSLEEGAIRPFQGQVYSESLRDLLRACRARGIRTAVPWEELSGGEQEFVIEGDPHYKENSGGSQWYGVKRFFAWLEANTYKMHVRVFLSRYRAYVECPDCHGARLQPEALHWKWQGLTLPDLYRLPVATLLARIRESQETHPGASTSHHQSHLAFEAIITRLSYLEQVGLGYLTLDRASRSLSGGETMRVNLTACLGTSLVDTLFVLDEPSIGLHARDIDCLISILKRLTSLGNTVVVVEHDESVMQAADCILEIGPEPGAGGGRLVFQGNLEELKECEGSLTGDYLSGRRCIDPPARRRHTRRNGVRASDGGPPWLHFTGVSKHNINDLDFALPLQRLVAISGVSGSGKSTLLNNAIYQGILQMRGKSTDDPARIRHLEAGRGFNEVVLVDQSPVSRTPRSNPALFCDAWDPIRECFAETEAAREQGLNASAFSFNSGDGRCSHCQGLGYEKIEMQFLSDIYVTCPVCEGKRFKEEILKVTWSGHSVAQILEMDVTSALALFSGRPRIRQRLQQLEAVGLGYLTLGQPLNTLSGGESQRLKLVKYLSRFDNDTDSALILLDEPTTGLHREDVRRLIGVLQTLVEKGNSVVVIEHQLDVLAAADWILEMGPDAGDRGGAIVAAGLPEQIAQSASATAPFLNGHLQSATSSPRAVAEAPATCHAPQKLTRVQGNGPNLAVRGAREHNLKDINLDIPRGKFSVITGVSGSGKSSLAFDIIFAEGQRRFMESMSAYARQFVEQLPRAQVDALTGIAPTVAIEQRVTRGSRKSTVATITEVAQYLRLLYARLGVQHHPRTGKPVLPMTLPQLRKRLEDALRSQNGRRRPDHLFLLAPVVRGRKGHHQPLADWASAQGHRYLRCDGLLVPLSDFQKLDRYREHDIELLIADFGKKPLRVREDEEEENPGSLLEEAVRRGKGSCFLWEPGGAPFWFSSSRTDPETGEAFPDLDPKHFSWNSAKGWCPTCRGHGRIYEWMKEEENAPDSIDEIEEGAPCPDCGGERLNETSRHVYLHFRGGQQFSLPELLKLSPEALLKKLRALKLDARGRAIVADLLPQIEERLRFMNQVGIDYLTLDRPTATLSGGEAQRIRLAAQLGSNLSGVLYVLDEPSIGLHARDNERLIRSLHQLKEKGNTLIVVEHDEETMRSADHIIDIGPGAGAEGGRILAQGQPGKILASRKSITGRMLREGMPHPLRDSYRPLPAPWQPAGRPLKNPEWLVLQTAALRNLRGDDLALPLQRLIGFCGVSGAGKSTLVRDLLKSAVETAIATGRSRVSGRQLMAAGAYGEQDRTADGNPPCSALYHGHSFRKVIEVDQSPIGKTPRSTPATYIGAFDIIREQFAALPEARLRGYTAGTFSFNTRGGRCEACKGAGRIKLEMAFLPDTYIPCEDCGGSRYGPELQDITWRGKNIGQVLDMTFLEAAEFFHFHRTLHEMLSLMVETGLGYLKLGQSSPTLSGGEAQRLKLVSELVRGLQTHTDRMRGDQPRHLYILEEPTIGLHLSDCRKLIHLLHRLVDLGHTVIVIEHQVDLLAECDYLVEVGPDGGHRGGRILYQGDVPGILNRKSSPTAPYLKRLFPPVRKSRE